MSRQKKKKKRNSSQFKSGETAEKSIAPQSSSDSQTAGYSFKKILLLCSFLAVCLVLTVSFLGKGSGNSKNPDDSLEVAPVDPTILVAHEDNPEKDGWETEVISKELKDSLKLIVNFFETGNLDQKKLTLLLDDSIMMNHFIPDEWQVAYEDDIVSVKREPNYRTEYVGEDSIKPSLSKKTSNDFYEEINKFRYFLCSQQSENKLAVELKIVGIKPEKDNQLQSKVSLHLSSSNLNSTSYQYNAEWNLIWQQDTTTSERKIISSFITNRELNSASDEAPKKWFVDYTDSILANEPLIKRASAIGLDFYEKHTAQIYRRSHLGGTGVSVADLNNDGWDDVYLSEMGGVPNRLLMHQEDGTVIDVAMKYGVNFLDETRMSLLTDLDNDGLQDLILSTVSGIVIYQQTESDKFVKMFHDPVIDGCQSVAVADYDLDGDLDIFVCGYHNFIGEHLEFPVAIPFHDANNGTDNLLLKNNGDFQFSDVTQAVGLGEGSTRWSYAAAWQDYDLDGDLDLYVANDFGPNAFYRNDIGHFKNIAKELGIEDIGAGMSACWCDINHDTYPDLYVGNMYSSAGNRIAFQESFLSENKKAKQALQRMARGNSLFINEQGKGFRDASLLADVNVGRWAWCSSLFDFNNDSHEDIYVTNGFVTKPIKDDL